MLFRWKHKHGRKVSCLLSVFLVAIMLLNGCTGGGKSDKPESTDGTENVTDVSGAEVSIGAVGGTVSEETTEDSTEDTAEETTEAAREYIVCLDAGHGGLRGAISPLDGRYESHDTLRLTLAIQRELEKYEHVTVIMTRTEDVHVENKQRPQMANDAGADLFVSIHRNSNTTGDKGGIEGWIDKNNPSESREVGEMILAAMEAVGVTANYGIKTGSWDEPDVNYTVIEYAKMPAVLLEVGYLNYAEDNRLFDENLDAYAKATAKAIFTWLSQRK